MSHPAILFHTHGTLGVVLFNTEQISRAFKAPPKKNIYIQVHFITCRFTCNRTVTLYLHANYIYRYLITSSSAQLQLQCSTKKPVTQGQRTRLNSEQGFH
jgi:hypothetical protein